MLKIKFSFRLSLILFLIFSKFSLAQRPELKKVINDIEYGEIEKAKIILVSLEKDNPNAPDVKFLKALLTEDGKEAARLYKDVAFSDEETDFKDAALFKLYQYHYSRGDFNESDKYARMLKETFPKSEYVNYLQRKISPSDKTVSQQKTTQSTVMDTTVLNYQLPQKERETALISNQRYSIQVGAFSSYSNAVRFASQFTGYTTKIIDKEVNGKKLFVVLLGTFSNEIDAKKEAAIIKNKYNIDGIITASHN